MCLPTASSASSGVVAEWYLPGFDDPGVGAFEVEDVAAARKQVLSAGGGTVGEIVTLTTSTGA